MKHFGFDRFPVIGQDRGGRVTHRLAARSSRQGVARGGARHRADALPLHALHDRVRAGLLPLVQLPAPGAGARERAQGHNDAAAGARHLRGAEGIPAHDDRHGHHPRDVRGLPRQRVDRPEVGRADPDKKITCPLRVLWAEKGAMGRPLRRARHLEGARHARPTASLPGGHNLQEDVPDMVLEEIQGLLKSKCRVALMR